MTRKEFLTEMFEKIFGYKGILYFNTNKDVITYEAGGTFIKDCTYSLKYKERVLEMIVSLFDKEAKKVLLYKSGKKDKGKNVEQYQERAKDFVSYIIKSENDNKAKIIEKINKLELAELKNIYKNIIIDEIFTIKSKHSKERGEDDFQESKNKISQEIIEYLFGELNDYEEIKQGFFNSLSKETPVIKSYKEIFYKSSMLRNYVDIEEYINLKNVELVDLSSETVADFNRNTVYKYSGQCFFESIGDMVRVSIIYNKEKISAVTSFRNWINQSIITNYIYENKSRYCECYFIYDQAKVFQFLEISEEVF